VNVLPRNQEEIKEIARFISKSYLRVKYFGMRIRKEISSWDGKLFIRSALILFVILNGFMVLLNAFSGQSVFGSQYNWVLGLMQPVLLASVFTYTSRKICLHVNDYQNIDSFREKLNQNILIQGMNTDHSTETSNRYVANSWFYKLFNFWGGVETVTVTWGNEIVIEGSSRIISQIEDSLTWNASFKSSRVTT
jgi:hypothetical protein